MDSNEVLNLDDDMELHLLLTLVNMNDDADDGDFGDGDDDEDEDDYVDDAFEMELNEQVDLNQMNMLMMLMRKTSLKVFCLIHLCYFEYHLYQIDSYDQQHRVF
jgi:hypothetical protein